MAIISYTAHWHKRLPYIIAVALIGRLLNVLLIDYGFPRWPGTWGGEMASIAVALAQGEGFSSPYWTPTGPTAFSAPVYPYLLSLIFRIAGVHEPSAGYVALTLNAGFSALICLPIYLMGRRLFGPTVAIMAAWLWALYPASGFSEAVYIWNTSLYTLLLTTVIAWTLCIHLTDGIWRWVGFGLLAGFTVLTAPVSLSLVPVFFVWLYFSRRGDVRQLLWASLAVVIVVSPWLVRNYQTFEQPVFLRSALGLALWCGVETDAFAMGRCELPGRNVNETAKYAAQGEVQYMREKLVAWGAWIQDNPGPFVRKTLRRFVAFWVGNRDLDWIFWPRWQSSKLKHAIYAAPALFSLFGIFLMIRKGIPGGVIFLAIVVLYPCVYYLSVLTPRFRSPIEPSMFLLSAYAMKTVCEYALSKVANRRRV